MNNVTIKKNGCWLWNKGAQIDGYACMTINKKTVKAHRFYYEAFKNIKIDKLQLHHKCRNKLCMNPDHLKPVTHKDHIELHKSGSKL